MAMQGGYVMIGGTQCPIKHAPVAHGSSGNGNEIVAAVTGKKIRLLGYILSAAGAVNAKWRSADATDLTGLHYFAAAGANISVPFAECGWGETAVSAALNLNLSGAVVVGGAAIYCEV